MTRQEQKKQQTRALEGKTKSAARPSVPPKADDSFETKYTRFLPVVMRLHARDVQVSNVDPMLALRPE